MAPNGPSCVSVIATSLSASHPLPLCVGASSLTVTVDVFRVVNIMVIHTESISDAMLNWRRVWDT
jgi:hypothetical protein